MRYKSELMTENNELRTKISNLEKQVNNNIGVLTSIDTLLDTDFNIKKNGLVHLKIKEVITPR